MDEFRAGIDNADTGHEAKMTENTPAMNTSDEIRGGKICIRVIQILH